MRGGKIAAVIVAISVIGVAGYLGLHYISGSSTTPLIVYSADAYVQETNYLLGGFHNTSGAGTVSAKGGGSYTDAREIGQGDPANAFVSVALESYNQSYLGSRYTGWTVAFASDQLVLAYSNASKTAQVNAIVKDFSVALSSNSPQEFASAYSNLTSGQVKVGISDPSSDPAGLRGWISLEIAGKLYAAGNQSYYVNNLVENHGLTNGSSAAQLISPLVTGQIQFLFIYKSAAISKGIGYISLPDQANFGDPNMTTFYSNFTYNTASGLAHGSIIFLYVSTLSNNGALSGTSLDFVTYTLNHSEDMASFGLQPLNKPILFNNTSPPSVIQEMVNSGKVVAGGRF